MVVSLLGILGSLVVFMTGLQMVSAGMVEILGPFYKRLIAGKSRLRLPGFLQGTLGAVLTLGQSRGIMYLASLADLELVDRKKLPWILLGLGFGGGLGAWVVTGIGFNSGLSFMAFFFLLVAIPFKFFRSQVSHPHADGLTGLGLVFLGIELLSGQLPLVPDDLAVIQGIRLLSGGIFGPPIALALGLGMGFLFRSSLGILVMAMALGFRDWINLETSAMLILGGLAGMSLSPWISAWKLGYRARRVILIQTSLSVIQLAWGWLFLAPLLGLLPLILPDLPFTGNWMPLRLIVVYTLIQGGNTLMTFPLHEILWALAQSLFPSQMDGEGIKVLPNIIPDALASNLTIIQSHLSRIADMIFEMMMKVMNTSQEDRVVEGDMQASQALLESLQALDKKVGQALTLSIPQARTQEHAEKLHQADHICHELILVAETAHKIMKVLVKSVQKQYRFHGSSRTELFDYISMVMDFFRYTSDFLSGRISAQDLSTANKMDDSLDQIRDKLKRRSLKHLIKADKPDPKAEVAFIEIVEYLERIGDYCLSISRSVIRGK